jgi:hypothetical protein
MKHVAAELGYDSRYVYSFSGRIEPITVTAIDFAFKE